MSPDLFRRVMGRFASGVTVLTATVRGETRGMTANAFMSGSLDPPLCVVSVAIRAGMHDHLLAAGSFAANILAVDQRHLALHFGGRPVAGLEVAFVERGAVPTIPDTAALVTADIVATHPCGDHTLFVGHVRDLASFDRSPLLFHAGQYASLAETAGPRSRADWS